MFSEASVSHPFYRGTVSLVPGSFKVPGPIPLQILLDRWVGCPWYRVPSRGRLYPGVGLVYPGEYGITGNRVS